MPRRVPPIEVDKGREHRSVYRPSDVNQMRQEVRSRTQSKMSEGAKQRLSKQTYNFPLHPGAHGSMAVTRAGGGPFVPSPSPARPHNTVANFLEEFMVEKMSNARARFDAAVRRRNRLMLWTGFLSVLTTVFWGQTIEDADIVGSVYIRVDPNAVQAFSSVLSIALAAQVVSYYRHQMRHEKYSWFILDSTTWKKHRRWFLAVELLVCALHPFPYCPVVQARYLAVMSVFRLHYFFRVLRDNSATYRFRATINEDAGLRSSGGVQFSWAFAFREFFLNYPWPTVLLMSAFSLCVFSYIVYIFERVIQSWTIRTAFWNTGVTMTTVGYGDYVVATTTGRVVASLAAASGLILASLLIFVVIQTLNPSPLERQASNIKTSAQMVSLLERTAAKYIQLYWVRYKGLRDSKKGVVKGFHAHFQFRNELLKSRMRYARRKLALIQMQTVNLAAGDNPDDNGGDMMGHTAFPSHNPDNVDNLNRAARARRRAGSVVSRTSSFEGSDGDYEYDSAIHDRRGGNHHRRSSASRAAGSARSRDPLRIARAMVGGGGSVAGSATGAPRYEPPLTPTPRSMPPPLSPFGGRPNNNHAAAVASAEVMHKLNGIEDMMYELLNTQRVMLGRIDALESSYKGTGGSGAPGAAGPARRASSRASAASRVSQRWSAMDLIPDIFLSSSNNNDDGERSFDPEAYDDYDS